MKPATPEEPATNTPFHEWQYWLKLELPEEAGASVDDEAGNGAGPSEDVEAVMEI